MERSSATSRGLVVLAPYHPTVTGVYLVERLVQENLVATVAFIQDDGVTGLAGRVRSASSSWAETLRARVATCCWISTDSISSPPASSIS